MAESRVTMATNSFRVADGGLQQHPVALQEIPKRVADRESQVPDADGVHHAGVSELTHAQLSVKHLQVKGEGRNL